MHVPIIEVLSRNLTSLQEVPCLYSFLLYRCCHEEGHRFRTYADFKVELFREIFAKHGKAATMISRLRKGTSAQFLCQTPYYGFKSKPAQDRVVCVKCAGSALRDSETEGEENL